MVFNICIMHSIRIGLNNNLLKFTEPLSFGRPNIANCMMATVTFLSSHNL